MDTLNAGNVKWIRVGSYWKPVADSGDEGDGNIEWNTLGLYYYHGFDRSEWSSKAWFLGTEDWTDTLGTNHPIWISGIGQWDVDENRIVMPVEDENGSTIRKYLKYPPPGIFVDGVPLHKPFPIEDGDDINTDKIPGTADVMLESIFRTNMGLTVNQKVLGYSQKNHDDYIIYDWTFTNSGNADFDEDIEYPNQTLQDVFFIRQTRFADNENFHDLFGSAYGEFMTDTLRIPSYGYPTREVESAWDNTGDTRLTGQITDPTYRGEAVLHVDVSVDDESDASDQPHMTGIQDVDLPFLARPWRWWSGNAWSNLYQTMEFGLLPYDGTPEYTEADGIWPGTHHSIRFDERGFKYAQDYENFGWALAGIYATGPFTLEPGDDFRIVWADVVGSISYEKGWEVGKAWLAGNSEVTVPFPPGEQNLPQRYQLHDDLAPTENDKNKARWIFSSLDSLHMNTNAAKWAFDHNYVIPEPPAAPSVWIWSRPDMVEIEWNYYHLDPSQIPDDLAGFRIYRAVEIPDTTWVLVGDVGPNARSFKDVSTSRGVGYYYHVAAYDDGLSNPVGAKGIREVLESGRYLNRTTQPVHLTRAAGTLDDIVVVPNPFNISAREIQYVGEQDKIMFLNIPGYCIIDIYTESGDHVIKIVHDDGSGDESWGALEEEFSATKFYQKVISGLYLARVEEINKSTGRRTGNARVVKFLIVR